MENLHIKFVNIKIVVSGKYNYGIGFSNIVNDFSAALNNFYWEMIFSVSKEELEDGKLDVKFKMVASSAFKYDVMVLSKTSIVINDEIISVEAGLKDQMKNNFGYWPLTDQLKRIAELILVTVKSEFK